MICKKCGTFNAENLTHCKGCGAKLNGDETSAAAEETVDTQEDGKPSRDFVKAPAWPTRAFSGAPENQPLSSSAPEAASAPSGSFHPTIPPRAASLPMGDPCDFCGKATVADAPFCPYCGQDLRAPAEEADTQQDMRAAQAAVAPSALDEFDDDFDDDEFDDEEEYEPKKSKRRGTGKMARRDDDFDDELDEYDEEFDDDEFDDMPKKRSKGTTILFWSLIVLLLALIAVFGMYIAKKNFDGDIGKMFSSIGSVFNKNSTQDVDADNTTTIDTSSEGNMYTASISEYTDPTTSEVYFDIDIYAPTGSTVRIITDATLKNNTATVPSNDHVILRIARDVFMPNAPVESEVLTISPNIQVISTDGQTTQLTVPDITVTVPVLSMTITEPTTDTVNATYDNSPIAIIGQVNDYDGEIAVFVNDQQVYVDSTGMFTSSYTPTASSTSSATTTTVDDTATTDETTTDETTTDETTTDETTTDET
ncbi:MAG TPA: zinc ribbon domain-containing protein, partial [Eubacteriales bacterium]|nr:zinc ribbon domain-containing protein [Eubacteriales bacterium]